MLPSGITVGSTPTLTTGSGNAVCGVPFRLTAALLARAVVSHCHVGQLVTALQESGLDFLVLEVFLYFVFREVATLCGRNVVPGETSLGLCQNWLRFR